MDRRNFIKTVLSTSLLPPLLGQAKSAEPGLVLFLISNHPQDHLPAILGEVGVEPSFWANRFSFGNPQPRSQPHMEADERFQAGVILSDHRLVKWAPATIGSWPDGGHLHRREKARRACTWQGAVPV